MITDEIYQPTKVLQVKENSKSADESLSGDTVTSMQYSPLLVAKYASNSIEEVVTASRFLVADPFADSSIVKIHRKEFEVGELLGEGAFSYVYEIARFRSPSIFSCGDDIMDEGEKHERKYVVKHLASDLCRNEHDLKHTALDLAKEAFLLASMDEHPHIIRLRGISSSGIAGFGNGRPDGFFLIFDKLTDTLLQRIQTWKATEQSTIKLFKSFRSTKAKHFLAKRIKIAANLASALKYLHEHNIMHRDIKPDNMGFDSQGNIKLFDFGIYKEIPDATDNEVNETYELTGQAGTFRYMAPEVAMSKPYNLKADVYSFTMLIWQMLTLERPFDQLSPNKFKTRVFMENKRPKMNKQWTRELQDFFGVGWSPNPSERPTIAQAQLTLEKQSNLLFSERPQMGNLSHRSTQ